MARASTLALAPGGCSDKGEGCARYAFNPGSCRLGRAWPQEFGLSGDIGALSRLHLLRLQDTSIVGEWSPDDLSDVDCGLERRREVDSLRRGCRISPASWLISFQPLQAHRAVTSATMKPGQHTCAPVKSGLIVHAGRPSPLPKKHTALTPTMSSPLSLVGDSCTFQAACADGSTGTAPASPHAS
jgi:hypothetical protein